ncbi:MAG: hypothetical protein AAGE86_10745 [Pseudomonadota bacterium]
MGRTITLCAMMVSLAALPACSLFDDTDWREGDEAAEKCAQRMSGKLEFKQALAQAEGRFVPTYTFDITKMGLEDVQQLIVPGSDETAGTRGMAATNDNSTAIDAFMERPVDEKGAFFLGHNPALYRVRGEPKPLEDVIASGCARQMAGMRLTDITLQRAGPGAAETQED